jgi:hypothetical protein
MGFVLTLAQNGKWDFLSHLDTPFSLNGSRALSLRTTEQNRIHSIDKQYSHRLTTVS